ncbi:hypothetical protein E5676_scaffold16G00390 [Cucumis melo var. makuwa]|uniref:Uncharacterized protein n=1 Tax=Cucumis melo var. makuwa TaxID=1194695 RepID=A0A5D3CDH6_CUCMM|nr:hypothetical protein E5676_scaffold16G00390 [Cucumis melo var. makuwa]
MTPQRKYVEGIGESLVENVNDEGGGQRVKTEEGYFRIHQLSDLEKIVVASISFTGVALHWYRRMDNS